MSVSILNRLTQVVIKILLSITKVFDSSKYDSIIISLVITIISIISIAMIISRIIFALTINRFSTIIIVKIKNFKLINLNSIKVNLFKSSYY